MKYLDGESVLPKNAAQARKLIGTRVKYLRGCDIDRSGRGYFFPRDGVIEDVFGRNVCIGGDYLSLSSFVEMVAA